jgi:hypothetical protein
MSCRVATGVQNKEAKNMNKDASAQLSEPVTAGVLLMASGAAKKLRRQTGAAHGLAGVAIAAFMNRQSDTATDTAEVIDFDGGGFIAVTPTRVVLFSVDSGLWRQKLGKPVATFHRGDLAGIELGKAALGIATVDLVLADRRRIRFELSSMFTKKLQPVADALGIAVTG